MCALWDELSGVVPWLMSFFREKVHFQEWWSKVCFTSSCSRSEGSSKRKRDSATDQNIQREEGASGSKPKLKIIRS